MAYDQFGHPLGIQPAFSWSVTGSGYSIDSSGLLTAGSTIGAYTVTVDGGGQSGSPDPSSIAPSVENPAAATLSSDDITASLSVEGMDMSGGSGLTYSWSVDGDAPGDVDFGDEASADTTATFDAAGTYKLTVAITNDAGLSVSSNVSVTVEQQAASIIITSDNPPVLSGATSSFTAEADDQFGARLAKQPSFTWSVTGAGNSIDGSGKATAGATPGSFSVTATSGSVSATGALGIYFAAFTPHLQDQSASISLNSPTGFSIIQGDTNGDPAGDTYVPYYVGLTSGPSHGQVTVHQDGTATYAPDHNFIGSDTFTIATYNADWLGGSENVTVDVTGDAPDSYDPGEPSLMTWGDGQDPNEGTSVTLGEHDNAWLAYGTKSIAVSNETADPVTFSIAGNTVTIVSTNASLVHDVEVDPTISLAAALSVNWTNSNSSDFLTVVANNAGNVTTAGSVTLYANNLIGAFNVGTMSAGIDGTFSGTIQSAGGVALSAWDIAGNITTTSSDIHVTARGDISGRIEAGGSVDASANGDVTNAASLIADTGSVGVTAFGDIAGTITGSTGVTVTAGAENVDPDGGAVSGQITSGNLISEDGDIEITGDQISATVNAIGATSIGIVASGNFSGTANGADGLVNVNVKDDVTGSVNGNGNIEISAGRDISGAVHSSSGDIVQLLAGGDISGNADADAGRINQVTAGGTISGDMTAQEDIGGSGTSGLFGITAGVDITGTITSNSGDIYLVQALRDMNGEVTADSGELHLAKGGRDVDGDGISADTIDSVIAGRDMDTDVESTEALGAVSAGRTIDGDITSDNSSIGGVAAGSGWSDAFTTAGKINGSTIEAGTGIGNVTVSAALNYDGAIKNATITANDGFIGNITAVSGIDVTATASESIGNIATPRGDISGSITATMGDIGDVSANAGNISAALTAGEDIGNILAGTNISGAIEAQRNIATDTGQSITARSGTISGNITSDQGSVGDVSAGVNVSGDLEAQDNIGDVTAGLATGGDITGQLTTTAGSIGAVTAFGKITKNITAGGSIGEVWAVGDIAGTITSGAGDVEVTSWGDVSGAIDAVGNIQLFAGNILASVTSTDGGIALEALQTVMSGEIEAAGDIYVWAAKDIRTQVTSDQGSVGEFALGTVAGQATAAGYAKVQAFEDISNAIAVGDLGVSVIDYAPIDNSENFAVCFVRGTPILLADGTTRPIETMEVGMLVLSAPENDPEGEIEARTVLQVYHNKPARIFEVRMAGENIRTTANHPFYVRGKGWVCARELAAGDHLRSRNGSWLSVTGAVDTGQIEPVFNLQIQDHHTYFVSLANGMGSVLVHNASAASSSSSNHPIAEWIDQNINPWVFDEPSTLGSLVPVIGPFRSALYNFSKGNWIKGSLYVGATALDALSLGEFAVGRGAVMKVSVSAGADGFKAGHVAYSVAGKFIHGVAMGEWGVTVTEKLAQKSFESAPWLLRQFRLPIMNPKVATETGQVAKSCVTAAVTAWYKSGGPSALWALGRATQGATKLYLGGTPVPTPAPSGTPLPSGAKPSGPPRAVEHPFNDGVPRIRCPEAGPSLQVLWVDPSTNTMWSNDEAHPGWLRVWPQGHNPAS